MVNAMHASVILEWHWGTISLAILTLTVSITALLHLLIHHRDHRSAGFWFALIVFSPLIGACLYGLLGINFVRRRGQQYRGNIGPAYHEPLPDFPSFADTDPLQLERDGLLAITLDRISRFHFSESNDVTPLVNGDEAMPAMLEAIRQAQTSIALSSYIFEATHIGAQFVEALTEAHQRGVEVRVMVDDAGTRYSWPPITRVLRKRGVLVRRFMPNRFVLRLLTMNLRNHKKILVVDGFIGFTGGMNIREGNMLARNPAHPVQDLHFKIIGPVVAQMQGVFAEDWQFCAGEILEGPAWFPPIEPAGKTHVLGIVDGPDEDLEVMPVALFAALSAATDRVCVMTPYFLPTVILMAALKLCATRGVKVTIVTPAKNNIPVVSWAARTLYAELLEAGCHIYESPGPFDHSKMLLIDGTWSCIGSTNWDPRSLRLNFEFNLACRCHTLNAQLASIFEAKKQASQEITLDALKDTSTSIRLRNGLARLFIPVL
ncbi:cardiolipin synthase [Prosthecobacter debontii]|uniref:Cardiolipin synthase n=2 Tax=Prosthecobacter debontii TaxID=48467 RepID=A0A1T4WXR9_9BACT|nr:cardiolipin synthase [Prosthecobacter debontii]